MKSKLVTALLALFLGAFGIHRFYLGQYKKGFLYLIFCFTLIPTLISFYDFFSFLLISEDKFNMKYNNSF